MERFAGILIEHYAGRFPVWLAPVQAIVLPVSERHNEYAERLAAELREGGVRVDVDGRSESVGKKIRDAELGRYPYMLVVGDREQEAGAVAVRSHPEGELGAMPAADFVARVAAESEAPWRGACGRPTSVYTPDTWSQAPHTANAAERPVPASLPLVRLKLHTSLR